MLGSVALIDLKVVKEAAEEQPGRCQDQIAYAGRPRTGTGCLHACTPVPKSSGDLCHSGATLGECLGRKQEPDVHRMEAEESQRRRKRCCGGSNKFSPLAE